MVHAISKSELVCLNPFVSSCLPLVRKFKNHVLKKPTCFCLYVFVFCSSDHQLGLPQGSIKASVLIESIFCSFELDQILFELRHHSAGLNCGMWDYSASLISNFGK